MKADYDLGAVARQFQIGGEFLSAEPYGSGHINDSYCVTFNCKGAPARAIVQRINHQIFKHPVAMMHNIERVTAHLAAKVSGDPDRDRRVLSLIRAHDGQAWHLDRDGNYWRAYRFIPHTRSYDAVETPEQAYHAGKAFGHFQKLLADLPAPRLHDTIPDFHHTPKRFAALVEAVQTDAAGRVKTSQQEIDFAFAREAITGQLLAAGLPERVTHNDTKLNNVLLDEQTGEAICVIDLDTVMPGLALYDFGDMVRTATSPAQEDERDLSKVTMQFPMFEALARGYLASAGDFLSIEEKQHLAFSGKLITFETGLRFLADHLNGDTYFKIHREGQNLDRCRTQFKLVQSIEEQEERMRELILSNRS